MDGFEAEEVFEGVKKINVGEDFRGATLETSVDFEACWRKGVVGARWVVKHRTNWVSEAIGRKSHESESDSWY